MKNKRLFRILIPVILLSLIPLIAMQFTDEVNWTIGDFAVSSVLLISTGLIIEYIFKMAKSKTYRTTFIIAVIALLLLLWAELAVGILGTPFSGT